MITARDGLTPTESRALEAIGEGEMTLFGASWKIDSYVLASRLWPHWRKRNGKMTSAAIGTATKLLKQLETKGMVRRTGKTWAKIPTTGPPRKKPHACDQVGRKDFL